MVPKVTSNVMILIVSMAVALLGLILTVSFFITFETIAALIVLLITLGILALTLMVGNNTAKQEAIRSDLRRLEKTLNDTAGSAGKSAPLIRDLHRTLVLSQGEDIGIYLPSPAPQNTVVPDAVRKLSAKLEEREKLESQALRQIVAEARLIRMYVERAGNDADKS